MKLTHILMLIALAVVSGITTLHFAADMPGMISPASVASEEPKPTAYERVISTQTLRCGYGTWVPGAYKDVTTGEMRGLFVELTEAAARLAGLKVEWAEEVDWGQIASALNTGRIDAFCAGMAGDAMRGKLLAYTNPLSYWTFDALVRADDARFPAPTVTIADLNNTEYATAYTEGDVLETIAKTELENVKGVALPPLGTPADNLMHVLTRKTDFVIFPKVMFQQYDKDNPGKLRHLTITPPLRAYGNVIAISIHELQLQQTLNAAVNELVNSGAYQRIMTTYDQSFPGAFLPVQPGYRQ
jgi:ABC-type amino acid transport substrate-binding protein